MKKGKPAAQPQIVVNITPHPMPDAPAYYIDRKMTAEERVVFKLAWDRMNKEAGTKRLVILIPEGTRIKTVATGHLHMLRKQIDEVLKERGVE